MVLSLRTLTACLLAARSSFLAVFMSRSTTPRSSLAFGAVVFMRPCWISCPAIVPSSALRCCASRPSLRPLLACLIALARQVVAVLEELGADLVHALHPEVADVHEFFLAHRRELADGVDALALEAVVGADRELQVLDRSLVGDHGPAVTLALSAARPLVAVGEEAQDVYELPRGFLQRLPRLDATVGKDLYGESVEVGAGAGSRLGDRVVHPLDRREQRVDRDDPDGVGVALVLLGAGVALAALDREAHVQVTTLGDARYVGLRVDHLNVGLQLYVGGRDLAGAVLSDLELYRLLPLELELQALHVEDDIDHVLLDAIDRGELVADALYANLRNRCAGEPGEHHAPQRVAQGVPQPARERLGHEGPAPLVFLFHPETGRCNIQHRQSTTCLISVIHSNARLPAVELDYELLLDGCVYLVPARGVKHPARKVLMVGLEPGRDGDYVLHGVHDRLQVPALLFHGYNVSLPQYGGRYVVLAPVEEEVPVGDELARLRPARREAHPVDHVVHPELHEPQQVLAADSLHTGSPVVGPPELLLRDPVVPAGFLLLKEPHTVLRLSLPSPAVLPRRVGLLLERVLPHRGEHHPRPPVSPASRTRVTRHCSRLPPEPLLASAPLGRAATVVRLSRDVLYG